MKRLSLPLVATLMLGCTGLCSGFSDEDGDGTNARNDCNDLDNLIHPGADEICDGIDQDCDGEADEGVTTAYYADEDGDGYGDEGSPTWSCEPIDGLLEQGGDCNDGDAAIHPDATEDCQSDVDQNCDGSTGYEDADGDGVPACEDCDDGNADIKPGADEHCDDVDEDCDGDVDESPVDADTWFFDGDNDGYGDPNDERAGCTQPNSTVDNDDDCDDDDATVNPDGTEVCNGLDDDCNGAVLEALVPTHYAHIQDALDAGEEWICLEAGTHDGDIDFVGVNATVESIDGPAATTIAGLGEGPNITFATSEQATLRGVTITSGAPGVYIYNSEPTFENVVFADNQTSNELRHAAISAVSCPGYTLVDSVVRDHDVQGYALVGTTCGDTHIDGLVITDNVVTGTTGLGVYCRGSQSALRMDNVSVVDNVMESTLQTLYGLGLYTRDCETQVTNFIVAGNETQGYGISDFGFGAYVTSADADFENISVTANTSGGNAHYGMLVAVGASNVTLNNADFSDNDIDGSLLGDVVGCHSSYDNSTLNVSYSNRYKTAGQTYYTPCMEGSFSTDDPAYVDPTSGNWDLTLSSGSDLIDAGDPDVDDADGSRSDIGAMGGPGGDDW